MDKIIELKNITKTYKVYANPQDRLKEALSPIKKQYYKKFNALDSVTFSIPRGETVGIIGSNGAGKSTLLKVITGILKPSEGELHVGGKVSALLELGAGFNMEFSGLKNIYLNGNVMGYTNDEIEKKIPEIIEFADIGEFINQPVKTYSSGMFARLAFAVAINVDPEILIVDEALSVGDVKFQLKCMNKMKDMMENDGTTVLFVSHDTNIIRRFCKKAIWLNKGKLIMQGDVNIVVDRYLDFLKVGDEALREDYVLSTIEKEEDLKPFVDGKNIAEIVAFKVLDKSSGKPINSVRYDTPISIEVIYDVYDSAIPNPVLGVAMASVDNDYVCGLNTLLDKVKIPWEYGRNSFKIDYDNGLLSTGGKYYFDAALMDETATVNFFYRSCIKEVNIITEYVGEGRYIIPHKWHA